MLADFDDSKLREFPLRFKFWHLFRRYKLPLSIRDISFNKFRSCCNYIESDFSMCEFLELTTGVNKKTIARLKISLSLPLYHHYKSECFEILSSFKRIGDEAPKAKVTVKDLKEFGLLPYVDYLAGGDITKYKQVDEMLLHEVLALYMLKVHQSINQYENAKIDAKNN